ncbi:MAG: hypothetical protein AAGM22_13485 [Acidobacteriota bacterium]
MTRPYAQQSIALLLLLLAAGQARADDAQGAAGDPDVEMAPDLTVESETPERGHYRLRGSGLAPIPPRAALEILTAFEEHCADGCRWPVSSLDHVEIVTAQAAGADGDVFTWTEIDDVMDASYFQRARRQDLDAGHVLTIEIPEAEVLDALGTERRRHRPFFQSQRVTWRLTPSPGGGTLVEVDMEMRSDSFLINLAPRRVLEGAEQNLQELFDHLRLGGEDGAEAEADS